MVRNTHFYVIGVLDQNMYEMYFKFQTSTFKDASLREFWHEQRDDVWSICRFQHLFAQKPVFVIEWGQGEECVTLEYLVTYRYQGISHLETVLKK